MKSLPQLFSGFGDSVTQAIEQALQLGVSLGQSVADIAASVEQALMQPLYRALTIAGDWMISGFRDGVSDTVQGSGMSGWIWRCNLSTACACCTDLEGTVHPVDEDMYSHLRCLCQQEFFSGEPTDIQSGSDWFDSQDESVQEDVLGSHAALAAYLDKAVTLSDFMGIGEDEEYGPYRYQRSLKEILGAKGAAKYYG